MIPPVLWLSYTVQKCSDTVLSLALTVFQFSRVLKALPHSEGFVCPSRGHCCLSRTETHVQHPPLVAKQLSYTRHGGELPNCHLMLWVAVSRNHLSVFTVPCYGWHLTRGVKQSINAKYMVSWCKNLQLLPTSLLPFVTILTMSDTHLWLCVDGVHTVTIGCIPYLDTLVAGAPSSCQCVWLPGTPGHGLMEGGEYSSRVN